jgi:FKBP-type peptidyl-prolyl cis-trans isomerase
MRPVTRFPAARRGARRFGRPMEGVPMKTQWIVAIALVSALGLPAFAEEEAPAEKPMTEDQKGAYALGLEVGRQLKGFGEGLDLESFIEGVRDVLEGREPRVPAADAGSLKKRLLEKLQKAKAERNRKEGQAFLEENAGKEGVTVTDSGLQYKVIEAGDGPKPGPTDTVRVHYRGTLIDGTEFDSSYKRGQPAEFPVNRVIAGWTEALQLMKVGAKYRLFIPSNLAYGERGAGNLIGPHSVLIFEVELLAIKE